jgi:hypothetical protein
MTQFARRIAVLVVLALAALVQASPSALQRAPARPSFLWKATSANGSVYLVGSVHMLTKDYYPLSASMDEAFKESDLLVEEIDYAEMLAPESQLEMMARGFLPKDQSLDRVLSAGSFAAVSQRIAGLGLPIEPLKRFKPWALALMLLGLEWQKAGFDPALGLDRHFYERARQDGKAVQGLETLAFQISRFDEMAMHDQERLLVQALRELDTQKAAVTTLADAWKAGDAKTIETIVLRELRQEARLYDRLLVERNRMWLPKIEALFGRTRPAFIVVGAAHLVGPDGLVHMMRLKGYAVQQR